MQRSRGTGRWVALIAALVATAAASAGAVTVALDGVVIARGATGDVSAALASEAASVAGVAVEIRLAAGLAPVLGEDGAPDCVAGSATGKQAFAHTWHGSGPLCLGPYDCNVLRVLVLSLGDSTPIPDGPLFRCAIAVAPAATIFALPVHVAAASASDPAGLLLSVAAIDGLVTVPMPPTATPFDTATPTPTPTPTPGAGQTSTADPGGVRTRKPTNSRAPTATLARPATTATATATRRGGGGGCVVVPPDEASLAPLCVALALLLARRRARGGPIRSPGARRAPPRRRRARAGRPGRAPATAAPAPPRPGPRRGG